MRLTNILYFKRCPNNIYVACTEENNGYIVWTQELQTDETEFQAWFSDRESAIERAVEMAKP